MHIPSLTLFQRTLNYTFRDFKFPLFISIQSLIILFFLLFNHVSSQFGVASSIGLNFFSAIVGINFFFLTAAGCGYFVSAVTEEKEEDTLSLLFLTGMSPFSILLGKGVSMLILASFMILSQIPFALIAITLGGINLAQIICTYIILFSYLVAP